MAVYSKGKNYSSAFVSSYPSQAIIREDEFTKKRRVVFSEEYLKPKQTFYNFEIILPRSLNIVLNNEEVISIPFELRDLYQEINKSKYILDLSENHDDQGGDEYNEGTWKKAIIFLSKYISWIYTESGKIISSPKIFHGPDGSIDIQWKTNEFKLLINVPSENDIATFYGNYQDSQEIEGSFNLENYKLQLLPSLVTI